MAANNEIGVVSDWAGMERLIQACNPAALWLVDCVQALGKLPLKLRHTHTRIDCAPLSGHHLTVPATLNFSVPGVSRSTLLALLDAVGVRVRVGSACSAATAEPSPLHQPTAACPTEPNSDPDRTR